MNLIGFVQALLINISLIAGINDPQLKVSPAGFLKALLENNALTEVNNIDAIRGGQEQEIKVRYQQRGTEDEVSDRDDCDIDVTPEWKEANIGHPLYSKIGIFISDEQFRKYQLEATQTLAAGTPSAPLMRALYETILTHCNGLIQKIDRNLVAAQSTKWGANAAYGLSKSAQRITLDEKASMTDGFVKIITDAQANEINDQLIVVGNGLVNAFDVYNRFKTGVDGQGFGSLAFNTYNDPKTATSWGVNHFGVFAKGNVGFVDFNKNVGSYAGEKGGSYFFTLPVPAILANGELTSLVFDAQLKYKDCPVYDGTGKKIADRGWLLILSKTYGLFNLPDTAFKSTDPLYQVNGSLHYIAQRAGESAPSAASSAAPAASSPESAASSAASAASSAEGGEESQA